MSINTTHLIDIIRGRASSSPVMIEFPDTEVDLGGIERDIEIEVMVGEYSETVYVRTEMEGEEDLSVTLPMSRMMDGVTEEGCSGEALGILLQSLDHEECIQVVHAIASARLSDSHDTQEKRLWERVHTAVTMPEPEPVETAETVIETDFPVTEEALAPAPVPDVGILVTPEILESHSSVKDTIKSILADEDGRLLMIGLLVDAGYAVGKKVS
jgi:hypothetical protein